MEAVFPAFLQLEPPTTFQTGHHPSRPRQPSTLVERVRYRQRERHLQRYGRLLKQTSESKTIAFRTAFQKDIQSLLHLQPNLSFSYRFAYQQCGQSLVKRNSYLQSYKRAMMKFGAASSPTQPFPFQQQWEEIRKLFRKEHLLRNTFRKFLYRWLDRRYKGRYLNKEDPSTLCEPEQKVIVHDRNNRGLYIFEAESLLRQSVCQLGNNRWLFAEPQMLRNPLTNVDFHLGQVISIVSQLRSFGKTNWFLEAFVQSKYSLSTFKSHYKIPLRLHALDDIIKHSEDSDLAELVEEFVQDEADYHGIQQQGRLLTIKWALSHRYSDPYVKKWHTLYKKYMYPTLLHGSDYYITSFDKLDTIRRQTYKLLISADIRDLAEERLRWIQSARSGSGVQPLRDQPQHDTTRVEEEEEDTQTDSSPESSERLPNVILRIRNPITLNTLQFVEFFYDNNPPQERQ